MPKNEFQRYICRPFCMFFREGAKEELACQGAQLIERLVQLGHLILDELPGSGEKHRQLWQEIDIALETAICQPCPFAVDGCDFHSPLRFANTEPCGGYILFRLLKENGTITLADL